MDANWWLGLLGLAVVFTVPGSGFAARFARGRSTTLLELVLHAAWVSLAINWLNVAVVRELGIAEGAQLSVLCGLAVVWAIAGWVLARTVDSVIPMGRNERLGVGKPILISAIPKATQLGEPSLGGSLSRRGCFGVNHLITTLENCH